MVKKVQMLREGGRRMTVARSCCGAMRVHNQTSAEHASAVNDSLRFDEVSPFYNSSYQAAFVTTNSLDHR